MHVKKMHEEYYKFLPVHTTPNGSYAMQYLFDLVRTL